MKQPLVKSKRQPRTWCSEFRAIGFGGTCSFDQILMAVVVVDDVFWGRGGFSFGVLEIFVFPFRCQNLLVGNLCHSWLSKNMRTASLPVGSLCLWNPWPSKEVEKSHHYWRHGQWWRCFHGCSSDEPPYTERMVKPLFAREEQNETAQRHSKPDQKNYLKRSKKAEERITNAKATGEVVTKVCKETAWLRDCASNEGQRGILPSNSSIVRVWTESCLLPRQPVLMTCQKLSTTLLNTTTRTSSMKSQRQSGNSRVPVLCYISPWNLQCSLTVFNEFGSEGKPVGNTTTKPLKK